MIHVYSMLFAIFIFIFLLYVFSMRLNNKIDKRVLLPSFIIMICLFFLFDIILFSANSYNENYLHNYTSYQIIEKPDYYSGFGENRVEFVIRKFQKFPYESVKAHKCILIWSDKTEFEKFRYSFFIIDSDGSHLYSSTSSSNHSRDRFVEITKAFNIKI